MIQKAIITAMDAHKEQLRKGTKTPYIVHPMEVAFILSQNGVSEDIIIAGLLHDTLEDTQVTEEKILQDFGSHILELVTGASEPEKLIDKGIILNKNTINDIDDKETWEVRKQHTIDYLRQAPLEIKLVSCADKLSNIRSMVRDYQTEGEKLWDRFNANRDQQKWYYQELVKSLDDLNDYYMYQEFREKVTELFG